MKIYKLFSYGTLKMDSQDTHYINADMWNVGQFPCVKLGGDNKVVGQLIDVTDYDLARLDKYEGVPSLYTREKTMAHGINSNTLDQEEVYVYQWARETDDLKRIAEWNDGRVVEL